MEDQSLENHCFTLLFCIRESEGSIISSTTLLEDLKTEFPPKAARAIKQPLIVPKKHSVKLGVSVNETANIDNEIESKKTSHFLI